MSLWAFALAAWEKAGVAQACLQLQDEHGQNVMLLLWGAWMAAEQRAAPSEIVEEAVRLAREAESRAIAPSRAARRAASSLLDKDSLESARAAELAAEKALAEGLERLSSEAGSGATPLPPSLAALGRLWNTSEASLSALSRLEALIQGDCGSEQLC